MVDHPGASRADKIIDAEYHNGTITLPAPLRAEWDARGVRHVRVTAEPIAEGDDTLERAIMRVQHSDREVVVAMLNAAGKLADTTFAVRIATMLERGT